MIAKIRNKFNALVAKRKESKRVGYYDNETIPEKTRFQHFMEINKDRYDKSRKRYKDFMHSKYAKQGTSKRKIYGDGFRDYLEYLGTPKKKKTSYQKRMTREAREEERRYANRYPAPAPGQPLYDPPKKKKKKNMFGSEDLL